MATAKRGHARRPWPAARPPRLVLWEQPEQRTAPASRGAVSCRGGKAVRMLCEHIAVLVLEVVLISLRGLTGMISSAA